MWIINASSDIKIGAVFHANNASLIYFHTLDILLINMIQSSTTRRRKTLGLLLFIQSHLVAFHDWVREQPGAISVMSFELP